MAEPKDTLKIIKYLKRIEGGSPWYGPSINDVLQGITSEVATARIGQAHSIVEMVFHMATWRNFVTNQLNGDFIEVAEAENFPNGNFAEAAERLAASQQALITAIERFPDSRLSDQVPGRTYSFRFMLEGIIQHDVYHLGQISILKKVFEK